MNRSRGKHWAQLIFACALLLSSTWLRWPASTRAQGGQWAKTYGGRWNEEAWSIEATPDGGCIVAGWTYSFGTGQSDFWVLKLSADGSVEWENAYGGPIWEWADLISLTDDGGYVVTGMASSFGEGGDDMWVLKLDASGGVELEKTFGGHLDEGAVSLLQTQDGGYVLAGDTKSFGAGDWDAWVLKLDATFGVVWEKTYGGTGWDSSSADPIEQTTDGGYILTGRTTSFGAGGFDIWVLKLDAGGAIQWQKSYGGHADDEAHSIRQTTDGGYAVAGFTRSFGAGESDVWVLKLDGTGAVEWQQTVGGPEEEECWSVLATSDGGWVVTGSTSSFGSGNSDLWVLKFAADGVVEWQRVYGGTRWDGGAAIRLAADGGYYVTGGTESFGADHENFWVLKLDADGLIPGCAHGASSDATIGRTWVTGVDCSAVPANSHATVATSRAFVRQSTAVVHTQCEAEPTATPSRTPTATMTRTPTCTPTTGTPTPVARLYLPLVVKQ